MKNFKKLTLIFSTLILIILSIVAFSQQKTTTTPQTSQSLTTQKCLIGVIDIQKAIVNHPKAEESMEILKNFQEERQQDLDSKTKNKELTAEEKEQINSLVSKYEKEIQDKDAELTNKLFESIKGAIEKVAKKKGLTVVLDKQSVFYGGVDITDEVIEELKKNE
jgi:outer membrane protein